MRSPCAEVNNAVWSAPPKGKLISLSDGNPVGLTFKGKLRGRFRLPFTIVLPSSVELPDSAGRLKYFRRPSSSAMRHSCVTITYRVVAKIRHGSLMRTDRTLGTQVLYFASFKPGPPSLARQLAYRESSLLVGPEGDPEGWYTLSPVRIHGTAFCSYSVEVVYTLSLARPLSYTRGSVIPLHLKIDCQDGQVLDLLSSPKAPSVWLLRNTSLGYEVAGSHVTLAGHGGVNMLPLSQAKCSTVAASLYTTDRVQSTTWCKMSTQDSLPKTYRELRGEIHLHPSAGPSAHFGNYDFFYEVAIYPPDIAGFSRQATGKLASVPVEVCTRFADGPRPVTYTTPTYEDPVRIEEDPDTSLRYNANSIGYIV